MSRMNRLAVEVCSTLVVGLAGLVTSACSVSASATVGSCGADDTLACPSAGSTGYSCTDGDTPESDNPNLSCSYPPVDNGDGSLGYCCFDFSGSPSTCYPDDTLSCPTAGSFGYTCAAGDDPTTYDSSLTCSQPTPDGPNDTFCCQ